jgi:hypothetical protein
MNFLIKHRLMNIDVNVMLHGNVNSAVSLNTNIPLPPPPPPLILV